MSDGKSATANQRFSLVVGLILVWTVLQPGAAGAELLDRVVLARDDVTAFTKWTGALARFKAGLQSPQDCPPPDTPCPRRDWFALVESLAESDFATRLAAVNLYINTSSYVPDEQNWGQADYWASPFEFLAHSGDCEDYAIAKYLTLRALGVDPAHMRVAVVDDLARGMPHAVLTVETPEGVMVLDNQMADVMPAAALNRYRAVYSINEQGWWLHRSMR